MSTENQFGSKPVTAGEDAERDALRDAEVEQALRDFKLSVDAWSEAVYSRPRTVEAALRPRSWRTAAGWALACVLVAGGVTGGVLERAHQQQVARIAATEAQQQARQEQLAAAKQLARERDQKLMATVDTDISQEVPSAMEPLADLMVNGGTQ